MINCYLEFGTNLCYKARDINVNSDLYGKPKNGNVKIVLYLTEIQILLFVV